MTLEIEIMWRGEKFYLFLVGYFIQRNLRNFLIFTSFIRRHTYIILQCKASRVEYEDKVIEMLKKPFENINPLFPYNKRMPATYILL